MRDTVRAEPKLTPERKAARAKVVALTARIVEGLQAQGIPGAASGARGTGGVQCTAGILAWIYVETKFTGVTGRVNVTLDHVTGPDGRSRMARRVMNGIDPDDDRAVGKIVAMLAARAQAKAAAEDERVVLNRKQAAAEKKWEALAEVAARVQALATPAGIRVEVPTKAPVLRLVIDCADEAEAAAVVAYIVSRRA